MKRNDEINHGMIDKLAYKGQDLDPNLLNYINMRIRKDASFCTYCKALDESFRGRGIPLEGETHSVGQEDPFIRLIPGTQYNQQKPKWLLITWDGAHPIRYCPMCGRKLDENSEITVIRPINYGSESIYD